MITKKKFLEELESSLSFLNESDRSSTIKYYTDYIESEMDKGRTLKSIVLEIGKPRTIARKLKKQADMGYIEYLGLFIDKSTNVLRRFFLMFSNNKLKDFLRIIVMIFVLTIILLFCKIPLIFLIQLVKSILLPTAIVSNLQLVAFVLIRFTLYLFYYIICFIVVYHYIDIYMIKYYNSKKLSTEKNRDENFLSSSLNISKPFVIINKIFGVFLIVIVSTILVSLITIFITYFCFLFTSVGIKSFLIILFGTILLFATLLLLLWTYLSDNTKSRYLIGTLAVISTLVMIIGMGVLPFELSNYNISDHNILLEGDTNTNIYEFDSSSLDELKIYNNGQNNYIEYEVVQGVEGVQVEVTYPSHYYNLTYLLKTNGKIEYINFITLYNNTPIMNFVYDLLYNFVSTSDSTVLYNYFDINMPMITVKANRETMDIILDN